MDCTWLLALIEELPACGELAEALAKGKDRHEVVVLEAARPYLVAALQRRLNVPVLVVTSQPEDSRRWQEQVNLWSPTRAQLYPEPEVLPGVDGAADIVTVSERLKTLSLLSHSAEPVIVISSAPAAASLTLGRAELAAARETVVVGASLQPQEFLEKWQAWGYELENAVEVPGTMGRRGGIVDIYPPDSPYPVRIELLGDRVESLRLFDPVTQKSLRLVPSAVIIPAREVSRRAGLLDHLPDNALVVLDDPLAIEAALRRREEQTEKAAPATPAGESAGAPVPWEEFRRDIDGLKAARLALLPWDSEQAASLPFSPAPVFGGKLESFVRSAGRLSGGAARLVVVTAQADRLGELLEAEGVAVAHAGMSCGLPPPGAVSLVPGALPEGWEIPGLLTLLGDREVFGFAKQRRLHSRRPVRRRWLLSRLSPGDYVVHVDHGIARFAGVTRMSGEGGERDYLVLHYAGQDRLYVPVEQMNRVSRYVGSGGEPSLTRLSSTDWARARRRVREAVAEIARELLGLYARREAAPGFAFSRDTVWQQELEASFPYLETPDQLDAIHAVKEDMEKSRPMDRIICGDVGYGKTEVALRAAFKAVMDNRQVAVLVPTTILAQQHYNTFRERLAAFPLRVAVLSRFCSRQEEEKIVESLAGGAVDICIGTHRLLQKDIRFRDLGLVVIDEEQRFGVMHKEHFKKLRREVDVLTLSATPIPRTLHMSLSGVRDLSTMETPPEHRLPVKTHVGSYDEQMVREAIMRELERNGQAFFVHNRVQDIALVARKLADTVPEARIAIAHGQMREDELERIVTRFVSGDYDVLVTTTIIESGVDLPLVNTLIVNQADRLGLTQLYQLRGRVGRGDVPAYGYFFYDRGKMITPQAQKRLETIFSAAQLGAGFDIAMKDLEIRGAGSVLGVEQSGHIAAVGFELYCQLLGQAVEEMKGDGQQAPRMPAISIDLPLSLHIPESYVPDLDTRLSLYRRLSQIDDLEQIDSFAAELGDRFGEPPEAVANLLYALKIKLLAARAAVEQVSVVGKRLVLRFAAEIPGAGRRDYPGVKWGFREASLDLRSHPEDWREVLEGLLRDATCPLRRVPSGSP